MEAFAKAGRVAPVILRFQLNTTAPLSPLIYGDPSKMLHTYVNVLNELNGEAFCYATLTITL